MDELPHPELQPEFTEQEVDEIYNKDPLETGDEPFVFIEEDFMFGRVRYE